MIRHLFETGGIVKTIQKAFQSPCSDEACRYRNDEPCICVCEAVTPVLRYCQLFGISPISLHSSTSNSHHHHNARESISKFRSKFKIHDGTTPSFPIPTADPLGLDPNDNSNNARVSFSSPSTGSSKSKCFISTHWKSLPVLVNLIMLLFFAGVTIWMFFRIHTVLTVYFDGTDLYTFGTQTVCLYFQCDLILVNSLLQRGKFCEIWELLIKVLNNLTSSRRETCCPASIPSATLQEYTIAAVMLQNLGQCKKPSLAQLRGLSLGESQSQEPIDLGLGVNVNNKVSSKFCRRLRNLRMFAFCSVIIALFFSICHTISFVHLVFHACFEKSSSDPDAPGGELLGSTFGRPPCPFSNIFLFIQKWFYGMIDFVQQGAAILFGTLCLIIYIFFEEIEDQLEALLRDGNDYRSTVGLQRHFLVENLRMAYEDLSRCCKLISTYFGLTVLVVSITAVISITCALYSVTLYSGAIEKEETMKVARYYVIWAFHGWFGGFCLTLILVPGQMVTNASEAPSQVIGRSALSQLDSETKYQLSQFQHQTRYPVVLTACNITNIGLGFIAAAATNVTTYILVILQFRLGVEKSTSEDRVNSVIE